MIRIEKIEQHSSDLTIYASPCNLILLTVSKFFSKVTALRGYKLRLVLNLPFHRLSWDFAQLYHKEITVRDRKIDIAATFQNYFVKYVKSRN